MIPHHFHFYWGGPRPRPQVYREFMQGWLDKHPGWTYTLWSNTKQPYYTALEQKLHDEYAAMNAFNGVADLLRYAVLWEKGGVYVDLDFECVRNIEPLLEGHKPVFTSEGGHWISTALIGAPRQHPFIALLRMNLPVALPDREAAVHTGPQYVTKFADLRGWRNHLQVYGPELFYPFGPFDNPPADYLARYTAQGCYAIHHWNHLCNSWRIQEAKEPSRES